MKIMKADMDIRIGTHGKCTATLRYQDLEVVRPITLEQIEDDTERDKLFNGMMEELVLQVAGKPIPEFSDLDQKQLNEEIYKIFMGAFNRVLASFSVANLDLLKTLFNDQSGPRFFETSLQEVIREIVDLIRKSSGKTIHSTEITDFVTTRTREVLDRNLRLSRTDVQ